MAKKNVPEVLTTKSVKASFKATEGSTWTLEEEDTPGEYALFIQDTEILLCKEDLIALGFMIVKVLPDTDFSNK